MNARSKVLFCLLPVLVSAACAKVSEPEPSADHQAALALMEDVFAAVSSGNPDDWRALQLAEGNNIALLPKPDGKPHESMMRLVRNEAFVANMSGNDRELVERWTEEPTVLVHGPIAVVWGTYDFRIDGEFSHCGINTADLVKVDGQWKLANITWTYEKAGCPTGPEA